MKFERSWRLACGLIGQLIILLLVIVPAKPVDADTLSLFNAKSEILNDQSFWSKRMELEFAAADQLAVANVASDTTDATDNSEPEAAAKTTESRKLGWFNLGYLANFEEVDEVASVARNSSGEIIIDNLNESKVVFLFPHIVLDVFDCGGAGGRCSTGPQFSMILDFLHNSFYGGYAIGWTLKYDRVSLGLSYGERRNVNYYDPSIDVAAAQVKDLTGTMITLGFSL